MAYSRSRTTEAPTWRPFASMDRSPGQHSLISRRGGDGYTPYGRLQRHSSSRHVPGLRADCWRPSDRERRSSEPAKEYQSLVARGDDDARTPFTVIEEESEDSRRVMPKNFPKPLTCFYWATQGHCAKSDDQCWYAHYWTDIVAAAPVRLTSQVPVAGKEAEKVAAQILDRNQILKEREKAVAAREEQVELGNKRLSEITSNLKGWVLELFKGLDEIQIVGANASMILAKRRLELLDVLHCHEDQHISDDTIHHAISAMNASRDELKELKSQRDGLKDRLEATFAILEQHSVSRPARRKTVGQEDVEMTLAPT